MAAANSATGMFEIPEIVLPYVGEIMDIDGHDAVPPKRWEEVYGHEVEPLRQALLNAANEGEAIIQNPDLEQDNAEINVKNLRTLRMEKAPGAFDLKRRLEVMDFTGTRRQILYPGVVAIYAQALYNKADDASVFRNITGDRKGYAHRLMDIYNDWCGQVTRETDRLRPTAILIADTPEALHAKMKRLIDRGVRLFMLPMDELPGGVSPASPALDPLWALAAAERTPVLGHITISEKLLSTLAWRDAPAFKGWMLGQEFSLDPWTLSTIHLQAQNFLTVMVLGGVFERHPDLKMGFAEFTGHWIGPMATNMDRWYATMPQPTAKGTRVLTLKPSDYVRRNVRVACFDFEPVGDYIDHYGLDDVYCYASDYPHHEGGKDPLASFAKSLTGKSDRVLRKFFVENGKDLLPD